MTENKTPFDSLRYIAIIDASNRYKTNPDDPAIQKEIEFVVASLIVEKLGEIVK